MLDSAVPEVNGHCILLVSYPFWLPSMLFIPCNEEGFYWVEDLLLPDSLAYGELENGVYDIAGRGHSFIFLTEVMLDIAEEGIYIENGPLFDGITIAEKNSP